MREFNVRRNVEKSHVPVVVVVVVLPLLLLLLLHTHLLPMNLMTTLRCSTIMMSSVSLLLEVFDSHVSSVASRLAPCTILTRTLHTFPSPIQSEEDGAPQSLLETSVSVI
jgi:hypothetical protein